MPLPLRNAWLFAANTITEDFAEGGFLNSQASDTQVFGFKVSSGVPVLCDDKSEGDDDYEEEDGSHFIEGHF
ncbi:hypothetical protein V5O48_019300 [Marasmius crinis-equi]|uniref:Uncharacterized protein n=1 Tax=Marasmius crinis-equi TaxID=585013 RepID=A0ABR3EIT2_9AGAR